MYLQSSVAKYKEANRIFLLIEKSFLFQTLQNDIVPEAQRQFKEQDDSRETYFHDMIWERAKVISAEFIFMNTHLLRNALFTSTRL